MWGWFFPREGKGLGAPLPSDGTAPAGVGVTFLKTQRTLSISHSFSVAGAAVPAHASPGRGCWVLRAALRRGGCGGCGSAAGLSRPRGPRARPALGAAAAR